jgi:hypothetical protein
MEFISEWGKIAGISGLVLGVFLILFQSIIRKNIFPKLDRKQAQRIIIIILIMIWTFGIIVIYLYYSNEGEETNGSSQLTVYVHGPDGKQDLILENTGTLIIDFGNDRRSPMIGENGRTNCGEIPEKFIGEKIGIGVVAEGYELLYPDSMYVMKGEPIYLAVKKDGSLGLIEGTIKSRDGQSVLSDVTVQIGSDTSIISNDYGGFKIQLPSKMTVMDEEAPYNLTVSHPDYEVQTKLYYPNSGAIEIRLLPLNP